MESVRPPVGDFEIFFSCRQKTSEKILGKKGAAHVENFRLPAGGSAPWPEKKE